MTVLVTGGRLSVSVGAAEADLLSDDTQGLGISRVSRWGCTISATAANVNIKVYRARGKNVGLVEVTALRTTIVAPGTAEITWGPDECSAILRVTAAAPAGTATVSCDFRGEGNF